MTYRLPGPRGEPGAQGPIGYAGTSTTEANVVPDGSTTISVTLETQSCLGFVAKTRVRAVSTVSGKWFEGTVTSYSGTTLAIAVEMLSLGFSGPYNSWVLVPGSADPGMYSVRDCSISGWRHTWLTCDGDVKMIPTGDAYILAGGTTILDGEVKHVGSKLGFFDTAPSTKPTITGSKGGNAALGDLITKLAALGLFTDNTSA